MQQNLELPAGGYLAEITMFTYRTALLVHIYCVYNESPLTIQAHDDRLAKENRKLPLGIQQMFLYGNNRPLSPYVKFSHIAREEQSVRWKNCVHIPIRCH
ncbi:hypothetical protein Zmor_014831 [Zophobas morio]|uniref:Uncharacterized protein n=1 Tax=Zophobas morio TaxID=2755281 RepID=A0AA38IIA6_9CUCU|nr:hypothetical protein Zmor_014831 [Zophobas morio]